MAGHLPPNGQETLKHIYWYGWLAERTHPFHFKDIRGGAGAACNLLGLSSHARKENDASA